MNLPLFHEAYSIGLRSIKRWMFDKNDVKNLNNIILTY